MKMDEWPGWTDWVQLGELDWSQVSPGPGTYMIAADRAIPRAVGTDEEGILDIGQSATLRRRLRTFWQCATGVQAGGHMAGWRFCYYEMGTHFPTGSLYVCWRSAETAAEAQKVEGWLIEEYVKQHLESPPLNYSASWRHLGQDAEPEAIDA